MASRHPSNQNNMVGHGEDWIEKATSLSNAFNKMIAKSACKMCNMYVDQQVEFENRQEDYTTSMARAYMRAYKPSMEVELYRQMMFDEDSVVEGVSAREDEIPLNAFDRSYTPTHRYDDVTVSTQKS